MIFFVQKKTAEIKELLKMFKTRKVQDKERWWQREEQEEEKRRQRENKK